jgi:hypothetical protein
MAIEAALLMRAEQYFATFVKAALSRNVAGVMVASAVEATVPTASFSPFTPLDVIAIPAVRISRIPRRTKNALNGLCCTGGNVPCHRWSCQ